MGSQDAPSCAFTPAPDLPPRLHPAQAPIIQGSKLRVLHLGSSANFRVSFAARLLRVPYYIWHPKQGTINVENHTYGVNLAESFETKAVCEAEPDAILQSWDPVQADGVPFSSGS